MTTRIAIVDDHPMVRGGLEAMLSSESGFEVVLLAENPKQLLNYYNDAVPQVVISDVRMPGMDGFALLETMRTSHPEARILLMAGMPLKEEEEKARQMGASGYLPKSIDEDKLREAIHAIAADAHSFVSQDFQYASSLLSQRELDTLKLAAEGLQREEIARRLGVGLESVKTYMRSVLLKLDAPNSTRAVARAFELGILRP